MGKIQVSNPVVVVGKCFVEFSYVESRKDSSLRQTGQWLKGFYKLEGSSTSLHTLGLGSMTGIDHVMTSKV